MPTWPTTTISTSNLDAGSDRPSLARADIKSMADVVNELVNYGAPTGITIFIVGSSLSGASGTTDTLLNWNETENSLAVYYNITSVSGTNFKFNITGRYLLWSTGAFGYTGSADVYLRNITTSTNVINLTSNKVSGARVPFINEPKTLTVNNTTDNYGFYYDSLTGSSDAIISNGITLFGIKIAEA